jgi:hypothetical protein
MKLSHSPKDRLCWNIHTYIYPICLRYFGLLGSMPHCPLLILIFILSSKGAKWNCRLSFYNLRNQLFPSIYPWLRNHCLAINNSSLLVSADMSHVSIAWQCPGSNMHTYINFSSDISALWAECHISPCLYSSLYLYDQVKEENETIPFKEINQTIYCWITS